MLQASLQSTLREKKITTADAFAVTDATPVHALTPLHALLGGPDRAGGDAANAPATPLRRSGSHLASR